jgi:hypothetical protein
MIILSATADGQNSAYRHLNMKGAFGNEGALRFLGMDRRAEFSNCGIGRWPMSHRLAADATTVRCDQ